jgi:flagellar biogenesis protein FliO
VTFSGLLQVLLGLALVVAAIVATGWLLRRIGPSHSAGGLLRVVGGVINCIQFVPQSHVSLGV